MTGSARNGQAGDIMIASSESSEVGGEVQILAGAALSSGAKGGNVLISGGADTAIEQGPGLSGGTVEIHAGSAVAGDGGHAFLSAGNSDTVLAVQ